MCWMVFWPPLIFKRDQIPYPLWTNMLNDFLTSVYLHESFQSTGTWWAINPHRFAKGLYRTITRNLRIFAGLGKKYVPILLFFFLSMGQLCFIGKIWVFTQDGKFPIGTRAGMRKQTLGDLGATCMEVARFLPGLGCSAGEKNQLCSRDGSTSVVLSVSKQFFFGPPTKVIFNHQL